MKTCLKIANFIVLSLDLDTWYYSLTFYISFISLCSGGFPVIQFSTFDIEKKLTELSMELQRLRMEGEYKMFIDSLSERNKSKNAIKGFRPCIESSLFKGN